MKNKKKKRTAVTIKSSHTHILLIIGTSLLLMLPLLRSGFPKTHDAHQHMVRTAHLFSAFKQGNLLPSWAGNLNNGLGSPVFLYNWLLPYYAALPLLVFGFPIVKATKLIIITEFVLSGIGFYFWMNHHFKRKPALLASLIFMTSPYLLFNIYIRGAIGESLALAIAPWVFLFTAKLSKNPRLKELALTSITLSLLILAHHSVALLILPMLTGYMLILWWEGKKTKKLLYFIFAIVTALTLTAFLWLPAVAELPFTKLYEGTQEHFKDHFIEADRFGSPQRYTQLIIKAFPLFNGLKPQILIMSRNIYLLVSLALGIGVTHLIVSVLAFRWIALNSIRYKVKKTKNLLLLFFFSIFLFSLFLTLKVSFPIWETIPFLKSVLFPWRFFGLATFSGSLLAGWVLEKSKSKKLLTILLLGTSLILIPRQLPKPESFTSYTDHELIKNQSSTDQTGLFLPHWAPDQENSPTYTSQNTVKSTQNIKIAIVPLEERVARKRFRIDIKEPIEIVINTFFFPGWNAFIDRVPTPLIPSPQGLIQLDISEGHSEIDLKFQPTNIRKLAYSISVVAITLFLLLLTFSFITKFKSKNNFYLLLISTLLAILIAETFTRLIIGDPYATLCLKYDHVIHHTPKPGITCSYSDPQNSSPTGSVKIHFNSHGLRGEEIELPKPPNTYRILMLGDSSTAAINILYKETFSEQLETRLQEKFPNKNIEVLNAGVPSYSILLEYLFLREKGLKFEPDLVVLNVNATDIHDDARYYHLAEINPDGTIIGVSQINNQTSLLKKLHLALSENSQLYARYLQFSLIRAKNFLFAGNYHVSPASPQFGQYEVDFLVALRQEVSPNYEMIWHWPRKSLKLIKNISQVHKIPVIVTVFPYGNQINEWEWPGRESMGFELGRTYSTRDIETMKSLAIKEGLEVVDMTEAFRNQSSQSNPIYFPNDIHFNPHGHEVFAQQLFKHISQNVHTYSLTQK